MCLILNNLSRIHKYNKILKTLKLKVHKINKHKFIHSLFQLAKGNKSLTPMIKTPLIKVLNL